MHIFAKQKKTTLMETRHWLVCSWENQRKKPEL